MLRPPVLPSFLHLFSSLTVSSSSLLLPSCLLPFSLSPPSPLPSPPSLFFSPSSLSDEAWVCKTASNLACPETDQGVPTNQGSHHGIPGEYLLWYTAPFTPPPHSHTHPLTSHTHSHVHKQRYCRGFIARRYFHRRLYSIVKIQSLIRMVVAKNKVGLMRIVRKKRLEVGRLRKEEEERLKKKMREQEARREAERLHQVRWGGG